MARWDFTLSGPGYFSTMGIPLLRGHDFSLSDNYGHQFVAVISESLAKQSFSGKDPIGHTIMSGLDSSAKLMTVIGLVAHVRQDPPPNPLPPTLYLPSL